MKLARYTAMFCLALLILFPPSLHAYPVCFASFWTPTYIGGIKAMTPDTDCTATYNIRGNGWTLVGRPGSTLSISVDQSLNLHSILVGNAEFLQAGQVKPVTATITATEAVAGPDTIGVLVTKEGDVLFDSDGEQPLTAGSIYISQ